MKKKKSMTCLQISSFYIYNYKSMFNVYLDFLHLNLRTIFDKLYHIVVVLLDCELGTQLR